jgi:hypothetical protein
MAYEAVAEELSDQRVTVRDLDAGTVAQAKVYAKRSHKKWPPRPVSSGWQVQVQTWRLPRPEEFLDMGDGPTLLP